jgi:chemotaxis protein histidine kinase CheA
MLHLVRNCVSHGVEAADVRRNRGKDLEGVVTLRARQESGQIVLEVIDDGGGLDLPAIHRRGIEMGLITADTPIDSVATKNLISPPVSRCVAQPTTSPDAASAATWSSARSSA